MTPAPSTPAASPRDQQASLQPVGQFCHPVACSVQVVASLRCRSRDPAYNLAGGLPAWPLRPGRAWPLV